MKRLKKGIWGIGILLIVLLALRNCNKEEGNTESSVENINTKSDREQKSLINQKEDKNVISGIADEATQERYWRSMFEKPIDFWVQVVDENGQPIEGVEVTVGILTLPDAPASNGGGILTTDNEGKAELLDQKGAQIHATAKAKGYTQYRDERGKDLSHIMIMYNLGESEHSIVPTANNPTILRLRKLLAEKDNGEILPIKTKRKKIGRNGEEALITANTEDGKHSITMKVRCWSEAPTPFNYDRYNWRAEIEVQGGKLLKMKDEYQYIAPETGYKTVINADMQPSQKYWRRTFGGFDGYHWVKMDDGRYGKFYLELGTGRDHKFKFEGFINTGGSRNLDRKF